MSRTPWSCEAVPCPTCDDGSWQPWKPCRTASGALASAPHIARRHAHDEAEAGIDPSALPGDPR